VINIKLEEISVENEKVSHIGYCQRVGVTISIVVTLGRMDYCLCRHYNQALNSLLSKCIPILIMGGDTP
jgi:hypothetical protein